MSRFTIGIPTYNRAGYLKRSLACAVGQTDPDVEILVSDNASTDDTEAVVRSFGDRVRYHRNATNVGMWPNFIQIADLARGDYFAWLQDDDALHCDFARRAVAAFDLDAEIAMYTAYSIDTHSHDTFVFPLILGPPIAMNWMNPRVRVVEGSMVLPISFFMTFSMPPITAYRTGIIREAIRGLDPTHVLYNERILQSRAVADRRVAVEPYLAGIFYKHEFQGSLLAGSTDIAERSRQWVAMVNEISLMLEARPADEWGPQLDAWLGSLAPYDLLALSQHIAPPSYWSGLRPLALEVCMRYVNRLPEPSRRDHLEALAPAGASRGTKQVIKGIGKQLAPPLVWDVLKTLKSRSGSSPR